MLLVGGAEAFEDELGGAMAELYDSGEPGRAEPGEAVSEGTGTGTGKKRRREWNREALLPFRWVRFEK